MNEVIETTTTASPQINELAAALAKAQGEMSFATKDSTNPAFRSRYADLASVVDAIRGPLSKYGIAFLQPTYMTDDGLPGVRTMLIHSSGQWISSELIIRPQDSKAHSLGSALTYARRYSLSALVGIAPDDDDGNAASGIASESKADKPAPIKKSGPVNSAPGYIGNVKVRT